jgi:hypothetical protein
MEARVAAEAREAAEDVDTNPLIIYSTTDTGKIRGCIFQKKSMKRIKQMGCPALGVWVAFFKQSDALPGRAAQKKYYELLVIQL